jgi:hypothetical protein
MLCRSFQRGFWPSAVKSFQGASSSVAGLAHAGPAVSAGAPPLRWTATRLTCRRVNDDTVLCQAVDKAGRTQVEFRRAP